MSARRESTFLRPRDGRLVAGVCAAVARRLGLDAVVVRGAWIVLALGFGLGIVAYLVLWAVVPAEEPSSQRSSTS